MKEAKPLRSRPWFYVLLLVLFFLPSYATGGYDPRETTAVITAVLSHPLIYQVPALVLLLSKLALLGVVLAALFLGETGRRVFFGYTALLLVLIAIFQHTADTPEYGFVALTGNIVLALLVGLTWVRDALGQKSRLAPLRGLSWRLWVVPVAFLAFWFPINTVTMTPDFSLATLVGNEAALTFCMVIPVVLAVLTLSYQTVDPTTLRISSFVGLLFGLINMLTWFGLNPEMRLMGILHLPLLLISAYGLALSLRRHQNQGA